MKRGKRTRNGWILVLCLLQALVIPVYAAQDHAHTDGCRLQPHKHEDQCLDGDGKIVCGYGDFFIHSHDGHCYDTSGDLVCVLPEIYTHVHDDSCYRAREIISGDRMILWEQVLVCTLPEISAHSHQESCFREGKWVCGQLEVLSHSHDASCFSASAASTTGWMGAMEPNGHTVAGLVQIVMGLGLVYLQILCRQKDTAISLKAFYKEG